MALASPPSGLAVSVKAVAARGVFADVGERDAFGLGGNAVAEGIGGGMGAACDGGEEEGEDVVVHGVS